MDKQQPNIIMIMLDQLRVDRLPEAAIFEQLKQYGTLFSGKVTYAPYTLASVYAVFSGMYGNKNGVDAYYAALDFDKENCYTLTQYLKDRGYFTKADIVSKILVPHQGFSEVSVYDEFNVDLAARHSKIISDVSKKQDLFFLYLQCGHIHTEMVKNVISRYSDFDDEYFDNQEKNSQQYNTYVKQAGLYMSRVFATCKNLNLLENTIFVIFSDHGCGVGERKGEKCYGVFTYDYSIKTFAYFIYPDSIPSNLEISKLTRTIDITPTILDMLDIPQRKESKRMQGVSLLPLVKGLPEQAREAYIETGGLGGPNPSPYKPNIKTIRTQEWKLIHNESIDKKELYNLQDDPKELQDLVATHPKVVQELWDKMIRISN